MLERAFSVPALRGLAAAASLGVLAGCTHTGVYDTRSVVHPPLTTDRVAAVRQRVADRLAGATVALQDAHGARHDAAVGALPPAAALALMLAVEGGDDAAVEADRWVRLAESGRVPVTVLRDRERWTVKVGAPNASYPAARATNLSDRWGLGPLESRGVAWTDAAAAHVDRAVALLGVDERRLLSGMPFVRAHAATGGSSGGAVEGARYVQDGCSARIELFDGALAADETNFAGEPERPMPESVRMLVHEIGHAIHRAPGREALCAVEAERAVLERRRDDLSRRITAWQDGRRLKADRDALAEERTAFDTEVEGFESRGREAAALVHRNGPVLEAYAQALGDGSPPTRYGALSLGESFAESFSLYRADPAALERLLPRVRAFFARDEHLRALRKRGQD